MVNCLCRETTMSIEEFFKLQRGELTIKDIRNNHKIETFAIRIKENKKVERFIVTLLACSLYAKKVLATTGIDALGWKFLTLIRQWAFWILLIMCIVEVVKSAISGDSKKVLSIVMKFLIIFASMYLVPELFEAIRDAFVKKG